MPTLYIRRRVTGDGVRYDVKYRRGGRYTPVEHGGSFRSQREARLRQQWIGEMLAAGKDPKRELVASLERGRPFGDVHAEWMASKAGVSAATRENYRHRSVALLDGFGRMAVDEIGFRDVIAWIDEFSVGHKPGTVKLHVGDLRQALDFAGVEPNPARDRRVELPKIVSEEIRPPKADDVMRILNGVDRKYRLPIVTMEQLACRVSETLMLTPDDVDVAGKRVRLPREVTKGQRKSRVVDAPAFLVDALAAGLPFRGISRDNVYDAMYDHGGFSPHDLRHRRASLWHQDGVVAAELARRLGNTVKVALDTYSHVMPLDEIDHAALSSFVK